MKKYFQIIMTSYQLQRIFDFNTRKSSPISKEGLIILSFGDIQNPLDIDKEIFDCGTDVTFSILEKRIQLVYTWYPHFVDEQAAQDMLNGCFFDNDDIESYLDIKYRRCTNYTLNDAISILGRISEGFSFNKPSELYIEKEEDNYIERIKNIQDLVPESIKKWMIKVFQRNGTFPDLNPLDISEQVFIQWQSMYTFEEQMDILKTYTDLELPLETIFTRKSETIEELELSIT